MKESKGKVHPKNTLFMRMDVGTASKHGIDYEMTVGASNMSPIVCSKKTGKYFTLTWEDILDLAVEAGINSD